MKTKKIISILIVAICAISLMACFDKEEKIEEPTYNTECDFVFYIRYNTHYDEYYIFADITNKTDKAMSEIRDLKTNIDFGNGITCKIWAQDIEFETALKPNETIYKSVKTYSKNTGLGISDIEEKKVELSKEDRPSISYEKQTYNLIYSLYAQ